MGDFLAPPRRQDVVERLRQRIDVYRQHHLQAVNRFNTTHPDLFRVQKEETEHVHQRWFESKVKKAEKPSFSKVKESGCGGGDGNYGRSGQSTQLDHQNLVTVCDAFFCLRCPVLCF